MSASDRKLDQLFQALADPTRRAILARLSSAPAPVTELAEPFDMALPSFLGHIAKLQASGLIETTKRGRVRYCALRPGAITPVSSWIEKQRVMWEARLDSLEDYLDQLMTETNS